MSDAPDAAQCHKRDSKTADQGIGERLRTLDAQAVIWEGDSQQYCRGLQQKVGEEVRLCLSGDAKRLLLY